MPAIVDFPDFVLATQERVLTPTGKILNDAVDQKYLLRESMRNKPDDTLIQGGTKITDRIQLEDNGSFEFYEASEEANPTTVQTLTKVEVEWRFARSNYSWNEEEITLNEGDQKTQFKKLRKSYEQGAYTSMINGMEAASLTTPLATMESGGKQAFSLMAFFDELGVDFHWPGFTTIMGVDPAVEERWRNQLQGYDSTQLDSNAVGVLRAFRRMFLKVEYESPSPDQPYFESDDLRYMKILTNLDGMEVYQARLQENNDRTRRAQDPSYTSPMFSDIPLKYITALDTQNLDQEALANSSVSQPWQTGEPRWIFWNAKYCHPVFHVRKYMTQTPPIRGGAKLPYDWVVFWNTYYNWFMVSRQRQGIITPKIAA